MPDPADPQSLNRFSYVLGNPLVFIDPTGHKEEGECGFNGESCSEEPPDLVEQLLSDPAFLAWLAAQVDSWLWENVPSAVGYYGDVSGSLGVVVEGELNAEVSLMFNWRSGELTFLYGPSAGVYLGTPRGGSLAAAGGGKCTFGASRNAYLQGVDVYYGGTVGADALVAAGLEVVGSSSLYYEDINSNGELDMGDNPALFVDPVSNKHVTSLQVGLSAGANGAPNGVEIGGVAGLSTTAGFNIIPGWDWKWWIWNWGKER